MDSRVRRLNLRDDMLVIVPGIALIQHTENIEMHLRCSDALRILHFISDLALPYAVFLLF